MLKDICRTPLMDMYRLAFRIYIAITLLCTPCARHPTCVLNHIVMFESKFRLCTQSYFDVVLIFLLMAKVIFLLSRLIFFKEKHRSVLFFTLSLSNFNH